MSIGDRTIQVARALPTAPIVDLRGRPLGSLRVSVTDRCNLRCRYCMPEEQYIWLPRADLLTFDEMARVVDVFASLGASRVRLTGGEPLLRPGLPEFVRMLAANPRIEDLALTTNGVLLPEHAVELRDAGLRRMTVSLDTLRPDRFRSLSRRDLHSRVIDGIRLAAALGFDELKLDTVVIRGRNEDEVPDLVRFARDHGAEVRFIEYMDVGGATHWSLDQVVSRAEMLQQLRDTFGEVEPVAGRGSAPAERFALPGGITVGIIASVTAPFCAACDRSRITADGMWYRCLYATDGTDLRGPLREGASSDELRALVASTWQMRRDRGAEERARLERRGTLVEPDRLRRDPHLEMHTRGG